MAFKKEWAPKPKGKPMCHALGCNKPAVTNCLCTKHDQVREQIDARFGRGHYYEFSCLSDKSRLEVVDRSSKKTPRAQPNRENDDD